MSDILRVLWTVVPRSAPEPRLDCNRCHGVRQFRSSEKIRVNANGKRLDAWLIYKCTSCDSTWKRPVLERRHVQTVDPAFLASLQANDPKLARRLAFDAESLRHRGGPAERSDDVMLRKEVLSESPTPARRLEILFGAPEATGWRMDRLLAAGLDLSRSRIRRLQDAGDLAITPEGSRRLRTAVRDGMGVTIELSRLDDRDRIARAAGGGG